MLNGLLGAHYVLIQLFVRPADLGHSGVSRRRTYIYCVHRQRCRHLYDVHEAYALISKAICKVIHTQPRDYLVASPQQVMADAMRVADVRRIPFKFDAGLKWGLISLIKPC